MPYEQKCIRFFMLYKAVGIEGVQVSPDLFFHYHVFRTLYTFYVSLTLAPSNTINFMYFVIPLIVKRLWLSFLLKLKPVHYLRNFRNRLIQLNTRVSEVGNLLYCVVSDERSGSKTP